jgi:hypothetical protein
MKLRILAFIAIAAMSVIGPAKAAWNDLDSKKSCIPDGVKLAELKEVFIKYAKNNPEKLNFSASSVTISAFKKAFPCE